MSSSELIIRRSRASYRGEGAFTTDGVAEGPIAPFRQPLSGLAGQAAGTVIRGRRSGLGPSAAPEGRRGSSAPGSDSDGPGLDRPGLGATSSALLQVDLRELRRRIEDRGYAAGRARAEGELAAAIEAAGALAA